MGAIAKPFSFRWDPEAWQPVLAVAHAIYEWTPPAHFHSVVDGIVSMMHEGTVMEDLDEGEYFVCEVTPRPGLRADILHRWGVL